VRDYGAAPLIRFDPLGLGRIQPSAGFLFPEKPKEKSDCRPAVARSRGNEKGTKSVILEMSDHRRMITVKVRDVTIRTRHLLSLLRFRDCGTAIHSGF
jgi:hypothetical protein